MITNVLFLLFLVISSASSTIGGYNNVVELGAKPDGITDCTQSFLDAWEAACNTVGSATIYVPPGKYLLNNVVFSGECKNTNINFVIDGTLVAPSDYHVLGTKGNWIVFDNVTGVSIHGGTMDGQGAGLWACKASGSNCPDGATTLEFVDSKNIVIQRLVSINSQLYHIVIDNCDSVKVQGVKIMAAGNSPNTDGIHVESSKVVTISSTNIKTGDDCISIGPGTTNLWIEGIACGPGHGISIGSLGKEVNEQGVQNVTVKTVAFSGTQNGLRIKTWARPSNGSVNGVLFESATMNNVENPIIIDQKYCPHNQGCPNHESGVKISNVVYKSIQGTSATQIAMKFDCSKTTPCTAITLEDVHLTYQNEPAQSSCTSADGSSSGLVNPSSCLA